MKQYVASLSYGKDSLAMLHVITDVLHWQLDRIITADVWATDTIPADLPPMVEFKAKADEIIKQRWGIEVEHFSADHSYQDEFYYIKHKSKYREHQDTIYGFPMQRCAWCNWHLKLTALRNAEKASKDAITYLGIAFDEPQRLAKLDENHISPLAEAKWTEQMCREWCEQNDLLSPIYTTATRGGCWFCHNQGVDQLRQLRKNYPDLWALLLKWDLDSPVTFHADGRTVHDFDRRFAAEDAGYMAMQKRFKWADLDEPQMNIFQFL